MCLGVDDAGLGLRGHRRCKLFNAHAHVVKAWACARMHCAGLDKRRRTVHAWACVGVHEVFLYVRWRTRYDLFFRIIAWVNTAQE